MPAQEVIYPSIVGGVLFAIWYFQKPNPYHGSFSRPNKARFTGSGAVGPKPVGILVRRTINLGDTTVELGKIYELP